MDEYVIQTEWLSKCYRHWFSRGPKALDNLSISVPRGSVFGFLGPNGAGKTTTIKILMDLIKPTEGSATVLGKPAYDVEVKKRIGFLPDSPAFSKQLTAREFLSICAKLLRIPSDIRNETIEETLETVKMADHAKEKLGSFSRGMLQRIGVAQALLNKPELLILDEPLLGLDPYGRQEFKQIIIEQQKKGTSVFFSSHILSDVEEICDRIAILKKGHLLCTGKLDDLLAASGINVVIAPGADKVFRELMVDAEGSVKNPDGGWTLQFPHHATHIKDRVEELKKEFPDAVTLSASREKLEDFFFRTVENANV